jgi:glycerate kinase
LREAWPELLTELVPMADGGEGTVEAFVDAGWRRVTRTVTGPLGVPVDAVFAFDGTTAVVEMASAAGIARLEGARPDPLRASSVGAGELVRAALDAGARRIVLAAGGSATNDGGAGFLVALGARFLDDAGQPLESGGAALRRLATVDLRGLEPRLREIVFEVAADVDNPLTGPRGASAVFGPQKGAAPADVALLDAALSHFADVSAHALGVDRRDEPGAGAAGGLGFAALAYAGAALRPGVALVADVRGLARRLDGARLCLTGEGSIDAQTTGGKTVAGVARLAAAAGVRVVAFGGRVSAEAERELARGGVVCVPLTDGPCTLDAALRDAGALLTRAAARVARLSARV